MLQNLDFFTVNQRGLKSAICVDFFERALELKGRAALDACPIALHSFPVPRVNPREWREFPRVGEDRIPFPRVVFPLVISHEKFSILSPNRNS